MENNYDIISVGLYERSWEDVRDILKDMGVTTVVDIRAQRADKSEPRLSWSATDKTVKADGFAYINLPSLDGKSKDPQMHVAEDLDLPVIYDRVMASPKFREDMETLAGLTEKGKVAVIMSNASAYNGAAARLVGQYLMSTTDKTMGHVVGAGSGQPRVVSQETVIGGSLGRGMGVVSGDFRNISFMSDGHWRTSGDTKVERVTRTRRAQESGSQDPRSVEGEWNFGSEGRITSSKGDRTTAATENAAWADYTVAISNSFTSQEARFSRLAAGDDYVQVRIPSDREEYLDEEGNINARLVSRVSSGIKSQIAKLVARDIFSGRGDFNSEALKVNIVGANIARLANEYKEMKVTEEEVNRTTSELLREGAAHVVEMTGPDQDIINEFMSMVMADVREGRWDNAEIEAQNGEKPLFRIGEVRTNGDSGIAEAAVIACQENGVNWNINTARNYPWVKDNETIQGEIVFDRPSFENRFKQGYVSELTAEQMRDQAHERTYLRSLNDGSLEPGLKDNQVALLQILGFNNNEITQMIDIAKANEVVIMDSAQMQEFIENCGGYGIASAEHINEAAVVNAQDELLDLIIRCEEKGISFITAANPAYPETLSRMEPYKEKITEVDVVMRDGSASVEAVEKEVESNRPAILWYKGDLGLLEGNTMAVIGNEASSDPYDLMYGDHTLPEEKDVLARELGREAAAAGVTTVATLQDGSEMTAVNEAMRHGGKAVVVSSQPLTSKKLDDYSDNVVKNGGLVLSEQAPVTDGVKLSTGDEHLWENRAKKLTAGLSTSATFIEGMAKGRDMNILEAALFLGLNIFVFGAKRTGRVFDRFKEKYAREDNVHVVEAGPQAAKEVVEKIADKQAPAVGNAVNKAARPARKVNTPQVPVQVLRMEGRQPIFLVSSSRPDIRQAIIQECGNNVQFAAPSAKADAMAALYGYPEGHKWKPGMGPEYNGVSAAVQKPMVHEDVVFFDRGKIYTLATAPDKYPGLKHQQTRQQNISAFESFRVRATELQDRFQASLDMAGSAPLYLAGSRYLAITPNSVEIREGSELRARVFLSDAGMIRFENIESLSPSLDEYWKTERPLLTGSGYGTPEKLDSLLGQIEEALYGRGQGESDQIALADREEQEALAQEITTGFRSPGSDNIDLAGVDVMNGIREGSLADARLRSVPEPELLYYNAQMTINEKKLARDSFDVVRQSLYERYEGVQQRLDGSVGDLSSKTAAADLPFESFDRVTALIRMVQEDVSDDTLKAHMELINDPSQTDLSPEILSACNTLYADAMESRSVMSDIQNTIGLMREKERDIAALEEAKLAIAKGETVRMTLEPGSADGYLIGGARISIPEHDTVGVDRAAILREMAGQKGSLKESVRIAERTEMAVEGRGKAVKEEIVSGLSNGFQVIQRDGKQAYADKDLNIVSDFYDKCRPFGQSYGRVEKDGKVNMISKSGNEILGEWALGIGSSHEGFAQVKRADGKMNLISTDTFEFVGDRWFSRMDIMSNGLAMVGNDRGQLNYIDTEGRLFSRDEWFAKAERFSKGEARITCLDGSEYTVNTKGDAYSAKMAVSEALEEHHVTRSNVKLSR